MIPIPTRILGSLLRGKATPFQIFAAAVLGSLLGFMPGFGQAPGLVLLLLILLMIVNANLFFAGFVGGFAKLLSLLLTATGMQFEVGMILVDGPLQPLARLFINAPVLAWMGFDNYVASGGLLLGLLFGLGAGVVLVKMVDAFRAKWASLESDSEKYNKYTSSWFARLLAFVLIGGGHGKKTYEELKARRIGLPVRPIGIAAAVLIVGLVVIVQALFLESTATGIVKNQLERVNGATVDLASTELDLGGGEATLIGFAMADPADLAKNTISAQEIRLDLNTDQLLRRRYVVDNVIVDTAAQGSTRDRPGVLIGRPPEPAPPPPPPAGQQEAKTIDDYIKEAQVWKERLARLKEIVDRVREARGEDPTSDTTEPEPEPKPLPLKERLRLQAKDSGYANVYATHLINDGPRLIVKNVEIRGLTAEALGTTLEFKGEWLSTDPSKVENALRLSLDSADDSITAAFLLPPSAESAPTASFALSGLSAAEALGMLSDSLATAFRGGTIDLALSADLLSSAAGTAIEAPLSVTLNNSVVNLPGVGETSVDSLAIPLRLSGPLDNPSILLDENDLADALVAAGKAEAARRIRAEADALIDDATDKLTDQLGDEIGDVVPDGALDAVRDGIGGGIGNLLGGGGKKDDEE